MTNRTAIKIIIALGVVGLLVVVACGAFAFLFVYRMQGPRMSKPSELARPGVRQGKASLAKSVFLDDAAVGTITDMILNPGPGSRLGLAGTRGALFVNADATVSSRVAFSSSPGFVQFVDIEGNGVWQFLNRGGGGWQDGSLLDQAGQVVWTCGGMPGLDDIAAGDVDGDGALDFVAGFNGGGGVRRLDKKGTELWQQPDGNVWHVEIVDTDGDGKAEIVHSNAGGEMTIRDPTGAIIRRSKPGPYFSGFSLCRWPNSDGQKYPLLAENDKVWIFDYNGKAIAEFAAPDAGTLGTAHGTVVQLRAEGPPSFAVVVVFKNWDASILYVYGPDKQMAYQEVIADTCHSVLALPREGSPVEDLLVGGTGKVWKYSAAGQSVGPGPVPNPGAATETSPETPGK